MSARHSPKAGLVAALLCLAAVGCQGYYFEEVQGTVIREKRISTTVQTSYAADILFVVDNSYSMAGEQRQLAQSFTTFSGKLEEYFGNDYRVGIVTTGVTSSQTRSCQDDETYCIHDDLENGRFQQRLGQNVGSDDRPAYRFTDAPECRLVTGENKTCFYDPQSEAGTALVGVSGWGYERGLAAMRMALSDALLGSSNRGFLREDATLVVVVISDEDDCGEPDEVAEELSNADLCYYAAKGVGPGGETSHPDDPQGRPYRLTPVEAYRDFLVGLKGGREDMVKFAAVTGVVDPDDLSTTRIGYTRASADDPWRVADACSTPGCSGDHCTAKPGTRYIRLAELFGLGRNGFVGTICQDDFDPLMVEIATLARCPRVFELGEPLRDMGLVSVRVNGDTLPRYSCSRRGVMEPCADPGDDTCSAGTCQPTWIYEPPGAMQPAGAAGGIIRFGDHFDPCELVAPGETVTIEVIYAVP